MSSARLWAASLGVVLLAAGCAAPKPAPPRAELNVASYEVQMALVSATEAVRVGDLEAARQHVSTGRAAGGSPYQRTKLDSLEQLINGAEAMMAGDVVGAREQWNRIVDPHLRREVDQKLEQKGLQPRVARP